METRKQRSRVKWSSGDKKRSGEERSRAECRGEEWSEVQRSGEAWRAVEECRSGGVAEWRSGEE